MTAEHALTAEQSDVALLGASDNRHALEPRIFAALARVTALAAHDHQPATLEQFADQSDEKSDQRAKNNDRDRASERLRKGGGQTLVEKSAERSAQHAAYRAIATPRRRPRRRSDAESDRNSKHAPSKDSAIEAAQDVERQFADDQYRRSANCADNPA